MSLIIAGDYHTAFSGWANCDSDGFNSY